MAAQRAKTVITAKPGSAMAFTTSNAPVIVSLPSKENPPCTATRQALAPAYGLSPQVSTTRTSPSQRCMMAAAFFVSTADL